MKRRALARPFAVGSAAALMVVAGSSFVGGAPPPRPDSPSPSPVAKTVKAAATVIQTAPAPAPAVSAAPTPESVVRFDERERARLAGEMNKWVTRHPRQLVEVITNLAEKQPLPVPATYLLSIAWSETRGKILAVSPAGAAGLAQATPSAYLSEGFDGKLFVTNDYLMGTRAFIMKKPLGDALTISAPLLKKNTPAARKKARALTARAIELRREGMDELEALRPVANDIFFRRIDEAETHNLATLRELDRLISRGAPRNELKKFRTRVQRDYTYLRNMQRHRWEKYGKDLEKKRDVLLRAKFGQNPVTVIRTKPYEAGEYLGRTLDARFSPTQMAEFLAVHLETKQQQARELGIKDDHLAAWTAALYNGGAVNVRRMRAGLIGSLRETQKYMKAVPARKARLDRALG